MKKKSVKSINQWQSVIQTTHDIVKAHGGSLEIESGTVGSVFRIILTR